VSAIIELEGVSRRYGKVTALHDVDLTLEDGRIHGLLGRNGAGKTTLMQLLTAQQLPSSGSVRVFGEDPYENPSVMDRICFIGENQSYPQTFKVRHVLASARIVFPAWDQGLADSLVDDFGLPTGQQVRKLSRGQRSAVGVVVGLASRAPLTFFDEPYLGLDAVARQLFYDRLIADYSEHPRTVVLSTHLIDEVAELVERVVVIDRGRILIDSDAETLRDHGVVVSGPKAAVEAFTAGHEVLHREDLGGFARHTVRGTGATQPPPGLQIEPLSLQQLVVRSTTRQDVPATNDTVREKVSQS
jgi:ABC-2 type transport system ATP-binding protein